MCNHGAYTDNHADVVDRLLFLGWQSDKYAHYQDRCKIKMPVDRIRAIIRIRPLIRDTQTNTLNW